MNNPALLQIVRTAGRRYKAHIVSGDHVLRDGSQLEMAHATAEYSHEKDPKTGEVHTNGYGIAPGGIGKTIYGADLIVGINTLPGGKSVLGDPVRGIRALVGVPSNALAEQWVDRLLGERDEKTGQRAPSIFGDRFTEDNVGVYKAKSSPAEKTKALSKPVVIIVHDSALVLHSHIDPRTRRHSPLIKFDDFGLVLIDEVDDRVRGDRTREFYKKEVLSKCLVIGFTATPLFKSGKTIGDYLFEGKAPIFEITHREAVLRKDIAPHINIIFQPEIAPSSIIQPQTPDWEDYTDAQKLRFIEQTGSDQAILDIIRVGQHPLTGKRLQDMMQMHEAVNVEHAKLVAKQLNKKFGSGYAEAVWGATDDEMNDVMRRIIKWIFVTGELKAAVQCKLLGRGSDFPALEMTVQHAPTLSPNKVVQFHMRASRKDDGHKTALYLSPHIKGIDQLIIGDVLGGHIMLPKGYEFPPTEGVRNAESHPKPWPEIKGVNVYFTQRQLEMFAVERRRQRYVNGLPIKTKNKLTLEEVAQEAIGVETDILRERVFKPLQEAYEKRQARQKSIDIETSDVNGVLYVRGKMFPVSALGFYQHKGQEEFCVDKDAIGLVVHMLYGRLDRAPPEMMDRRNVRDVLGCKDVEIDALWRSLQLAFFDRRPYERHAKIEGVELSHQSFGFYENKEGKSEFLLSPDALISSYRLVTGANKEGADNWAKQPAVKQYKTSTWLMESEVNEALELHPILGNREIELVRKLFSVSVSKSQNMRSGQEWEVEIGRGTNKQNIQYAKRWLPMAEPLGKVTLCVHKDELHWIEREIGMKNRYDSGERPNKRGSRPEKDPRPGF